MRKRALSLAVAVIVGVALVSASGAATTTERRRVTKINVSTRAAVVHYLRSIHVKSEGCRDPARPLELRRRSLSRQGLDLCGHQAHGRPDREAGRTEPVRLWNREMRCRAVRGPPAWLKAAGRRVAALPPPANTALCIKTTGVTQSCMINQPNASGTNKAVVWMVTPKLTGLTQSASYTASITQGPASATGSSNTNLACVLSPSRSTARRPNERGQHHGHERHSPVDHDQPELADRQQHGPGRITDRGNPTYDCDAESQPLTQDELLTSTVTSKGSITQKQDTATSGSRECGDSTSSRTRAPASMHVRDGVSLVGNNSAAFKQSTNQAAVANTTKGPR